ncbi:RING finger protein 37 [Drosophila grimshawi]|uniref:GH17434 n=1 Tax=Drosophila grimshawi TaxID=7222 RepID=B4JVB0_DROGR|nr:RING finger protein 37 [Drosophila grimshawi]EDV91430.1 GH17434 [Drosophila grimshawi]
MSSLINFLNPKLKPSVECDAVCEDGYTAANLIADDAEQVERGFMCFAVCKPPVEIVFDFPKAIDLKVIKLWPSSGALRSTGFEVHGKYDGIWERVAYVRDLPKGMDSVTFCYQSDYNSRSSAAAAQQHSEKVFFFKTAHKILGTTNSVKIVIRATERCPPVLRKIQMWGLPARSLDKADRELMKTIWSEISDPYGLRDQAQQQQAGQRSPSRHIPELREQSSLEIPEEFLDSITWELMTFPTVLPSGKVVDQSTIDKHAEEEAKWGRLPSDPFTGLEYTSQRKAILNLAIKARIEKFLMEHSEHFKSVPRCLGSSRMRRRHASQFASHMCLPPGSSLAAGTYSSLSSVYKQHLHQQRKTKSTVTATATSAFSGSGSLSPTSPPAAKRLRPTYSTSSTVSATVTASNAAIDPTTTSTPTSSSGSTATSSIDQAIQTALQKITRFSQVGSATPLQPPSCINCRSGQFAYEIRTCRHLVCRECLVMLSATQQCVCKVTFRGVDVERYHKLP